MDRTYITLNENWKFHYGEVPEGWYKGYDCRMTGPFTCRLSRLIPAELDI